MLGKIRPNSASLLYMPSWVVVDRVENVFFSEWLLREKLDRKQRQIVNSIAPYRSPYSFLNGLLKFKILFHKKVGNNK